MISVPVAAPRLAMALLVIAAVVAPSVATLWISTPSATYGHPRRARRHPGAATSTAPLPNLPLGHYALLGVGPQAGSLYPPAVHPEAPGARRRAGGARRPSGRFLRRPEALGATPEAVLVTG